MYSFHGLLSSGNEFPVDSTALAIDWVSWSRQARGTTSRLARAVTLALRKFMGLGNQPVS